MEKKPKPNQQPPDIVVEVREDTEAEPSRLEEAVASLCIERARKWLETMIAKGVKAKGTITKEDRKR